MENNFIFSDDLLWDYVDGFLGNEEKLRVEAYLRQNPEQKARLDAILAEKRAFASMTLEKPDAGFAQQVMMSWAAEQAAKKSVMPDKTKGRDWILWSIALGFGVIMVIPFLFAPAAGMESIQIPQKYFPTVEIPSYDWAGLLGSSLMRNALLLTLAMLSLKLLDKYLQVKKLQLAA